MKIPAGKYIARAVPDSYRLGKSTDKGTDYCAVDFRIVKPEEQSGDTITWTGWLTSKAAQYAIKSLRLAGWNGDDLDETPLPGLGANDVELVIEGEEAKNGNVYSKVRYVNAIPMEMDADSRKKLTSKFGDLIKESKALTPPPAPEGDSGDDIPF